MTGAELIKWIQDNHAEELEIAHTDHFEDEEIIDKAEIITDMYNRKTKKHDMTAIYLY